MKLPTRLRSERWLRGFDLVPGDRRVVRSAFLFLEAQGGREQWLGGWTPWHAMTAPPGVAYRLPAGAVLTLELHYRAWEPGDAASDRSEVGLYLDSARPTALAQDLAVAVPAAGGASLRLRGEATLSADSTLWAFRPRLANGDDSVRGSIELAAVRPDGATLPLLWIRDYQPDWQTPYVLREPVRLPRGSRLTVTAYPASPGPRVIAEVSVGLYSSAPSLPTAGLGRRRSTLNAPIGAAGS